MLFKHALLLALAVAGVALAGCQPPPDAVPEVTVLERGNGGEPGSLDPARAEDIHAFNILADLYEGLVAMDAAGEIVPGVAERWQQSADGLSYTFRLRSDAAWSNGDPVASADFVRAFRRIADPELPATYAFLLDPIRNFRAAKRGELPTADIGVVADGERQLTVTLELPTPWFLSILAMPIASPVHASIGDAASEAAPVSNGAFLLHSRTAMGPIHLQRNPHYWSSSSVWFDEVVYHPIVDENAELNRFRAGELDITHTIPPGRLRALLETDPDAVRLAPMLALYYIAFDMTEAPFDDSRLRQALSMAVDRHALVELIGRGEVPAYGIVPPKVANYRETAYPWRTLDDTERLELARRLLDESGYEGSMPIGLLYDAGGIHERIAVAVSAMWRDALGIDVTLEKREWQHFLDTRERRDEWQLMRFAWFGDYNDPMTFLEIFASDSVQNLPRYRSDTYDALVLQAATQTDAETRLSLIADAERTLLDDYPVIPLYFFVSKHLVRRSIEGFEDNVLDRHPSRYLRRTDADGH